MEAVIKGERELFVAPVHEDAEQPADGPAAQRTSTNNQSVILIGNLGAQAQCTSQLATGSALHRPIEDPIEPLRNPIKPH